ncbi:MAG: hypothetical protein MJZ19_02710 [Paludibacteraceae bacterium]|nr:hypothetical protein [Paludibacteraceae bacterium]
MKEVIEYFLIASFFFSFFCCSKRYSDDVCDFRIPKDSIRNGDLVFRLGRSVESRFVKSTGEQCGFSHVGIMVWFGDTLKVVHAVPEENKNDSMVCENIESFLCEDRAQRTGFFKVVCNDSLASCAAEYGLRKFNEGCMFDHDYDLDNDDKLYCTEFVWRAYKEAGVDISMGSRTEIATLFVKSGEVISPQDLMKALSKIKL